LTNAGNSYSGGTNINGGAIAVNGAGSIGTGNIIVGNTGILKGNGTIALSSGGNITVQTGGTIRGGNSIGTLTVGSDPITVNVGAGASGAILETEISHNPATVQMFNTNADSSLLALTGAGSILNLNPGAGNTFTLNIVPNNTLLPDTNYVITIASVATAGNIQLNGNPLAANDVIATSNYTLTPGSFTSQVASSSLFVDATGTQLQLSFTTTPEPHHLLLIAAGVLLLGYSIRRKSQPCVS